MYLEVDGTGTACVVLVFWASSAACAVSQARAFDEAFAESKGN
jgi:hypothetical protein